MGSLARKQRRESQRKFAMANLSNEKADACIAAMKGVQAVKENEIRAMKPEIAQQVEKRLKEKVIPEAQGHMFLLFLFFMHEHRGYGLKRLHDLTMEFNDFADMLMWENADRNQLTDALAECGYIVDKEFAEAEARSNKEQARRMKARKG